MTKRHTLGQRVLLRRRELGWTQKELGRRGLRNRCHGGEGTPGWVSTRSYLQCTTQSPS
jgi:hypothetical protein